MVSMGVGGMGCCSRLGGHGARTARLGELLLLLLAVVVAAVVVVVWPGDHVRAGRVGGAPVYDGLAAHGPEGIAAAVTTWGDTVRTRSKTALLLLLLLLDMIRVLSLRLVILWLLVPIRA